RKAPQRSAATREESLWERNDCWKCAVGSCGRANRCGEGQRDGIVLRHENPNASGACKAKPPFDGVVRGILKEKAQEAGAGAKIGARIAEVCAIETSLGGIGRIVPRIAEPGHPKL